MQLVGQRLDLLGQIALELEQLLYRLELGLGPLRVEPGPAAEHGLLDLIGDHRPDLAEIFADYLHPDMVGPVKPVGDGMFSAFPAASITSARTGNDPDGLIFFP